MFQIHLSNWDNIEFIFAFKLHIPPFQLRRLEFYTIENILKKYEEYVDKENKEYEKQQSDAEKKYSMSQGSYKAPSFGQSNYKMPKYEMPKLNVPKL